MLSRIACAATLLCSLQPVQAFFKAKSDHVRCAMVELYSSEATSAANAAESWLGDLRKDGRLWKKLIPLQYHVDYLNGRGWDDPFSQTLFTNRLNDFAKLWQRTSIYTPAFALNGTEWANNLVVLDAKLAIAESAPVLEVVESAGRTFHFEVSPLKNSKVKTWQANLAVLGNEVQSKILGGENQGGTLVHNFLVLNFASVKLAAHGKTFAASIFVPENGKEISARSTAKSFSLVAWVAESANSAPLQAVGADWNH